MSNYTHYFELDFEYELGVKFEKQFDICAEIYCNLPDPCDSREMEPFYNACIALFDLLMKDDCYRDIYSDADYLAKCRRLDKELGI